MTRSILGVGAAALLALAAPAVGAQVMSFDADAPNWGLDAHEVRVLQLALRDADCYQGRIDGRVGPGVRAALRCAHERTSTSDPTELARELALYEAVSSGTTTRQAAGDVEPAARPARPDSAEVQRPAQPQPRMQQRDTTMQMRRDTTMRMPPRDTMMPRPPRDTTAMPMPRDTTAMPRDTTRTPPDTARRVPPPR